MKRVLSASLLLGTLLFVTACGAKPSNIKSIEVKKQGCIQKKGCEKEPLLLMKKPHKEYIIDISYLTPNIIHNLKTIQGKSIKIVERKNGFEFPQYSNKIVVLEFFGKDCPHCMKEIISLNKIRKKYEKNLEVVSIQVEEPMGESSANRLIKKHKIKYPLIDGDESINLQSFVQETYGWRGILPYTLILKNGLTEFSYSGKVTYKEMQSDIGSLI